MSKVIERAVGEQLNEFLATEELLSDNQSAYQKRHSAETTMLRVLSDALAAANRQQVTLIGLLDLSAAFDCVDQVLLLHRLVHHQCGLSGTVLRWMTSIVSGRTQQVAYHGQLSPVESLLYSVLQGSVLGPLLFILYIAELWKVMV